MKKLFGLMVMVVLLMQSAFAANLTVIIDGIYMTSTREVGKEVTLTSKMAEIVGWEVKSGGVTIENNKFMMPDNDVVIEAITNRKYLLTVSNLFVETMEEKTERQTVEIQATSNERYKFMEWLATGIELTDEQLTSELLTFTMPSNEVTLEAIYEVISLEWDTTGQLTKTLKLKTTSEAIINWGDGTREIYPGSYDAIQTITHTYDVAQNYEVKIGGYNNIMVFSCENNQISTLDVSKNIALTDLWCQNNSISVLDVTNNTKLITLYCFGNNLSQLDVSKNIKLQELGIADNYFTSIDISANRALTRFTCQGNQLTEIDLSKAPNLHTLYCYSNNLSELDVSNNTALSILHCFENSIEELDVTRNIALTELRCEDNELSLLNLANNSYLTILYCFWNNLTSLDVSGNTALQDLRCSDNPLTTPLDLTNNNLTVLSCQACNLSTLDISNSTNLTELYCGGNALSELNISANTNLSRLCCYQTDLNPLSTLTINVEQNANMTVENVTEFCNDALENTIHKNTETTIVVENN